MLRRSTAEGSGLLDDIQQFPVAEDELAIAKRVRETGRLVLRQRVATASVPVREQLESVSVEVERVPIGREVAEVPRVRSDGGVIVVPVIEERLVVEKRLFLVEEVHIRERRQHRAFEDDVTLRRTEVTVERRSADDSEPDAGPPPPGAGERPAKKENE